MADWRHPLTGHSASCLCDRCDEPAVTIASNELPGLKAELAAARSLLAALHRDGGHHTERVGFAQSCADAQRSLPWMLAVIEAAEDMRDTLTIESFALPAQCASIAAFDAALSEWRRVEG